MDVEGHIQDNLEKDSEEEEDDSPELSERFSGKAKRHIPEQMQIYLWGQSRKCGSDFTDDEWKSVNQTSLIKSYNSHPEACMFSAQLADSEVPDLKFKDKKDLEKQVRFLQILMIYGNEIFFS